MDREFEERYWANRTIRPHTAVLLDVSDTAGKAHADSMTEAHLAWVEVDAQVDRARRKEQRARQQERNLRAGLPPGKQAQQTSWKEQKLADDERLAISRRLATRLEQQQNRASYLADGVLLLKQKAEIAPPARHPIILAEGHTGRPAIKDQAAAASSANQGAKHLPVQEQEQSNLKQGSGLVLGASARAESVRSCSSTATQSARKYSIGLSSFREAAETINSALEAAISSSIPFASKKRPSHLASVCQARQQRGQWPSPPRRSHRRMRRTSESPTIVETLAGSFNRPSLTVTMPARSRYRGWRRWSRAGGSERARMRADWRA